VAIKELYDAVVEAMQLNEYPEPDIRDLGEDDAASILLDPSRTFQDFGDIEFTPLKDTVKAAIDYYNEFGAAGGYTHLKIEENKS
jgi:nucleoside-diphosphate-sugar epimerase